MVFPTDTVYGIAADAFSPLAVTLLLASKGRSRKMPPPVLIPQAERPRWPRHGRSGRGAAAGRGVLARRPDPDPACPAVAGLGSRRDQGHRGPADPGRRDRPGPADAYRTARRVLREPHRARRGADRRGGRSPAGGIRGGLPGGRTPARRGCRGPRLDHRRRDGPAAARGPPGSHQPRAPARRGSRRPGHRRQRRRTLPEPLRAAEPPPAERRAAAPEPAAAPASPAPHDAGAPARPVPRRRSDPRDGVRADRGPQHASWPRAGPGSWWGTTCTA